MAPSGSNGQPWSFVVIQGTKFLKDYSERGKALLLNLMNNRPDPHNYKEVLTNPDFNLFYNAGTLIIIYGDLTKATAAIDCCLSAQNLMLAAHASGLGTCWIGFSTALFDSADLKQELKIPAIYKAVASIIVGYPEGAPGNFSRNEPQVLAWM